jgi:multicomponent K+:H+ antiporter subunit D
VPRVLVIEIVPVMFLLFLTLALTVQAGPAMQYMDTTIRSLSNPRIYIDAVRKAAPIPDYDGAASTEAGGK